MQSNPNINPPENRSRIELSPDHFGKESNMLFWEKYRPQSIDDIILLPRVSSSVKDGIKTNLILHGSFGCGKSSLAKILIKKHPSLSINSSLYTSIDVLRQEVDKFCSKMSMFDSKNDLKVVFLDEIDRVSKNYQDALKAFIEEYESSVRFIATTNHINRIDAGVKSRFIVLDFGVKDSEEEKFLKNEYAKRLALISKSENIGLDKKQIIQIVTKNFPDLRQMTCILQDIKASGGEFKIFKSENLEKAEELYNLIISKSENDKIYSYLFDNYGHERIDYMFSLLGRPFIEWIIINKKELINSLENIMPIIAKYSSWMKETNDPFLLGYSMVCEIKKL